MYDELYAAWKRELEIIELQKLQDDFYSKVTEYLRRLKEESRMLDNRTVKARLLRNEMKNVRCMLQELVKVRYRKMIRMATKGDKEPSSVLTSEEQNLFKIISPSAEVCQTFVKSLLRGHVVKTEIEQKQQKTDVLRFLKDVPAIVGSDLKTYGPFKSEDVASLPVENAKIFVKQGLAEKVDVT